MSPNDNQHLSYQPLIIDGVPFEDWWFGDVDENGHQVWAYFSELHARALRAMQTMSEGEQAHRAGEIISKWFRWSRRRNSTGQPAGRVPLWYHNSTGCWRPSDE